VSRHSGAASGTRLLAPDPERIIPGCSVVAGRHAMASWTEVAVDGSVRGQNLLGMASRLEPLHLTFSAPGQAMRVLRPVVEVTAFPVLDVGQDLALGRAVTPELVGHDHPRGILQAAEQLLDEALGGLRVAPALDEDVEHDAVLIHGAPEICSSPRMRRNTSSGRWCGSGVASSCHSRLIFPLPPAAVNVTMPGREVSTRMSDAQHRSLPARSGRSRGGPPPG